jgi:hypothetical protein
LRRFAVYLAQDLCLLVKWVHLPFHKLGLNFDDVLEILGLAEFLFGIATNMLQSRDNLALPPDTLCTFDEAAQWARPTRERRLLAQSGHRTHADECPLLGVKQTSTGGDPMPAFDPTRTWAAVFAAMHCPMTHEFEFGVARSRTVAPKLCNESSPTEQMRLNELASVICRASHSAVGLRVTANDSNCRRSRFSGQGVG